LCSVRRAVLLNRDEWMVRLFGKDERPATGRLEWYQERRARCLEHLWALTKDLAPLLDVVLEPGLVQRAERQDFYRRLDTLGCEVKVLLLDAPREVRRARVLQRNGEPGAQVVPPEFFELASDAWEAPDDVELEERAIERA